MTEEVPGTFRTIGFSAFYHVLAKIWDLTKAHNTMRIASENEAFQPYIGEQLRQVQLQRQLEQILA